MYTLSLFAKVFLRGLIYLEEISEIKVLLTMGLEPRRTLCIYEQIFQTTKSSQQAILLNSYVPAHNKNHR